MSASVRVLCIDFVTILLYLSLLSLSFAPCSGESRGREVQEIMDFFSNDSDRLAVKMTELQPKSDQLMHTFLEHDKIGVMFSGVFTNNTVLQREPYHAAVYGTCDTPLTNISLTLRNIDMHTVDMYTTVSMDNRDWKIVFNESYANGGNYSLTVDCAACHGGHSQQTLYNITFGDVYFCSGQSNMNLEMHFTFSRNYTYDNITQYGKYSNIRFYSKRMMATKYKAYVIPSDTEIVDGKYQWHLSSDIERVSRFSATCWYFAQSLIDKYNMSNTTFGLIQSAVDGSKIEYWIANNTLQSECEMNTTICPDAACGACYNGMVLPFINMTIKSVLWYQGENNVFEQLDELAQPGIAGDILSNTGYACMQRVMVNQWRTQWSTLQHTTSESLPFGIVQLAAGTSEGNKLAMPYFRWAQTANYGILPNPHMLHTFVAQAYDVGDPWSYFAHQRNNYPAPYDWNSTHWLIGSLHPRSKIYVGERLAMGARRFIYGHQHAIWQGPLIKGCSVHSDSVIRIEFNAQLLSDEHVVIQPFSLWYNESLAAQVRHTSAFEIYVDEKWIKLERDALSMALNDGYTVNVNVSGYAAQVERIRYAWSDSPCCGDLSIVHHACPMNLCPIITSKSRLPALPFDARIVDGKCECYEPQKCDGSEYSVPGAFDESSFSVTTINDSNTMIEFTKYDHDWPRYICIVSEADLEANISSSTYGKYERVDVSNSTDITVPYYRHLTDANMKIFYDAFSSYWQIGDVQQDEHNLVCYQSLSWSLLESPLICDQWFDAASNIAYSLSLDADSCGTDLGNGEQTLSENSGDTRHWNVFQITLYSILLECFCLFMMCIYCRAKRRRRKLRRRNQKMEELTAISDDEEESEQHQHGQHRGVHKDGYVAGAPEELSESDQPQYLETVQQHLIEMESLSE